jgi:hypothetical protein
MAILRASNSKLDNLLIVKRQTRIFFVALACAFSFLFSCTKVNEGTELGGGLIPAVDNITTFDTVLSVNTFNLLYNDTTKVFYSDLVAGGHIVDPEFGTKHADFYFNLLPATLGIYPFVNKDSAIKIDSVVLQLAYAGGYGDTMAGIQTFRVFEIAPNAGLNADSLYRYTEGAFATTGGQLGSRTFAVRDLDDSIPHVRPRDTAKRANVLRIPIDTMLARRFVTFDTTNGPLGGFHSDSSRGDNFRRLFAGLAVRADQGGNVFTYFNLRDVNKTKLTVYFKVFHTNGIHDTLSYDFFHATNGQSNPVTGTPGGNWAASLNGGADDKVYLQTAPSGSYTAITIPALGNFPNRIVHRAELIVEKIPSANDVTFTPPSRLILDRRGGRTPDTTAMLFRDLVVNGDGSLDFTTFGGNLRSDNSYRFNITRHVQGIITRKEPNDTLRIYAPLRTELYAPGFTSSLNPAGTGIITINPPIGNGRLVAAGGSYAVDPARRMRLRIIYSRL